MSKIEERKAEFKCDNNLLEYFEDVSNKIYIEYHFPNGSHITIKEPLYLAILETGENLICDSELTCYKIRPKIGWWKTWKVKKGEKHFTNIDAFSLNTQKEELLKS